MYGVHLCVQVGVYLQMHLLMHAYAKVGGECLMTSSITVCFVPLREDVTELGTPCLMLILVASTG